MSTRIERLLAYQHAYEAGKRDAEAGEPYDRAEWGDSRGYSEGYSDAIELMESQHLLWQL